MTAHEVANEPRSRRALLAGLLGGAGVWAASMVSRAAPAEAAAGDPIRMGRLNKASSTATTLQTKTSAPAYQVTQIGAGAAVKGVATSGRAIMGVAGHDGTGVWAYSPNHYAVHASSDGVAVNAESDNVAIFASGGTIGVNAHAQTALVGVGNTAALLNGQLVLNGVQQMSHQVEPAAPAEYSLHFFARLDGAGKTQLCVKFHTGAVQVIASEA
jgi:hypothetical protein